MVTHHSEMTFNYIHFLHNKLSAEIHPPDNVYPTGLKSLQHAR